MTVPPATSAPAAPVGTTTVSPPIPTTTTGTVTPSPAPEPFFTGGDWVTLGVGLIAALIAYLAYRAAVKSAAEAKRSADAAERSATAAEDAVEEQRTANKLTRDRDQREQAEKRAAEEEAARAAQARSDAIEQEARKQAGMVTLYYSYNGSSIDVAIINNCKQTFRDLLLVDVVCADHLELRWRRNPKIFGGPQVRNPQLWPMSKHTVPVVFNDDAGRQQYELGKRFGALVRFTDDEDRRWEVGDDTGPRRVPLDDGDLAESAPG